MNPPYDPIFQPLAFRNLTVKNRLLRSSISGRFDNYDGSGARPRIEWELKFARGGVGAIISSYAPVHRTGQILPNYAMIDEDDKIPFWRELIDAVHKHDCRYIIQLSHGGRQRDIAGVGNAMAPAMSSSAGTEPLLGLYARQMSIAEIRQMVDWFAQAARRARLAGADGVELHASHGYLFTQFLSSALNRRRDSYGGTLENRARFLREVIAAIRQEVGDDFHLQAKINAIDIANFLYPWRDPGNDLHQSLQILRWAVAEGLDAVHVSLGSSFPHPLMPPGGWPADEVRWMMGNLSASGIWGVRNQLMLANPVLRSLFLGAWNRVKRSHPVEGIAADLARQIRQAIDVPVICTGGFQDGALIRRMISEGWVDAVSIARPLIANPDLPRVLADGSDLPDRPCSFCNRCLVNAPANPLGCYDVRRFDGDHEAMISQVMSVFHPEQEKQP